ncbi:MAG: hypothetical protein ABR915_04070 [Thermoguttaceae bacterium]
MIPAWKVQAIQTLLAEGQTSQRQIAKRLKVWRGVVAEIARGLRPVCRRADRDRSAAFPRRRGPPQRCSGCGGLVYLPCLACSARAGKLRRPRGVTGGPDPNERLELRLTAADRLRYEEIRARLSRELVSQSHPAREHGRE